MATYMIVAAAASWIALVALCAVAYALNNGRA